MHGGRNSGDDVTISLHCFDLCSDAHRLTHHRFLTLRENVNPVKKAVSYCYCENSFDFEDLLKWAEGLLGFRGHTLETSHLDDSGSFRLFMTERGGLKVALSKNVDVRHWLFQGHSNCVDSPA